MSKTKYSILDIQTRLESRIKHCSLCGGTRWELEPDLFNLRLGSPWASGQSKQIRCVILNCPDCGNTAIVNVQVLLGLPMEEETPPKKPNRGGQVNLRPRQNEVIDDVSFVGPEK